MAEMSSSNGDSQHVIIERELARTRELLNGSGLPSIAVDQDVIERELARGRALISSRSSTSDSDMVERTSPNWHESDEDKMSNYNDTSTELIVIQLEGQLESISQEHSTLLNNHGRLQNKYVVAQEKLKSKEKIVENAIKSRDELSSEIDQLKLSHNTLNLTLKEARDNLIEKEKAIQDLINRIQESQISNHQLEQRLATLKVEIGQRDTTVVELRQEMEVLQSKWDQCITEKVKATQELKVAHSAIESLEGTQSWLQKQLKFTQDARSALDNELTIANKKVSNQSNLISNLRTENDQLVHNLQDHWQTAVKEKKQLMEYLSLIETDMLAREMAMKEATTSHDELHQRMDSKLNELQTENDRLQANLNEASVIEQHLNNSKIEINEMQDLIDELNKDKQRLEDCLRQAEQCIEDRENNLQLLQAKYNDVEDNLTALQKQQTAKDTQLQELIDNIEQLRDALKLAQDEKQALAQAMEVLQSELKNVKHNYDEIERDKEEQEKQLLVIQQEKEDMRQEVELLQVKLDDHRKDIEELTREHYAKETQVEQLRVSRATVESELEVLRHDFDCISSDHAATKEEKDKIENQLQLLRDHLKELDQSSQAVMTQPVPSEVADKEAELSELKIKNEALETELKKAGSESRKELTKLKAKIARLTQDLENAKENYADQLADYQHNLELKESKCQQLEEENQQLLNRSTNEPIHDTTVDKSSQPGYEANIESIIEPDAAVRGLTQLPPQEEDINQIFHEPLMESTTDYTKASPNVFENNNNLVRPNVVDNSMQTLIENISNRVDIVNDNMEEKLQRLRDQLEREKGRRKGLEKIQMILRQHSGILQNALGKQELALEEIIMKLKNSQEENQSLKNDHSVAINKLQQQLGQNDLIIADLNNTVTTEKKQNSDLNQQYNQCIDQMEESKKEIEDKHEKLELMQNNLNVLENKYKIIQQQYQDSTESLQHFQAEADARQQALDDRVMKLQAFELDLDSSKQQLTLKQDEITTLQQQLEQLTNQHQLNNKRLQERIDQLELDLKDIEDKKQMYKELIKKFTLALERCRGKLAQVVEQLPSDVAEKIRKELELDTEDPEEYVELLWNIYKNKDIDSSGNRSIKTLQNCLSELRQEMTTLQERMDEHKKTVQKVVYSQ